MDDELGDAAGRRRAPRHGPRSGEPADRGRAEAVGLDLSRLAEHREFAPVVEYLTAIQDLRADGSSLLFVRGEDLDAMAERQGRPVPEFLERLDQLGVAVSAN